MRDIVLECKQIYQSFGENEVLHDINLQVIRGEIVAIVGPSGHGKSTLLKIILGTLLPTKGEVIISVSNSHMRSRSDKPDRNRGIVYQRYSLFPNLTALENVAFGLMLDQTTIPFRFFRPFAWKKLRKNHLEQSRIFLEKFGLGDALNYYPHEMSGGMCQRVAIAQALITKPEILLLDEPFGALDESTREEMQHMLLRLYEENLLAIEKKIFPPYTILIVTHEIREAIYVSDRVIGLSRWWNWDEECFGVTNWPGASIVYDQPAPTYNPEEEIDFALFKAQKDEILRAVFDDNYLQKRQDFVNFWNKVTSRQIKKGVADYE